MRMPIALVHHIIKMKIGSSKLLAINEVAQLFGVKRNFAFIKIVENNFLTKIFETNDPFPIPFTSSDTYANSIFQKFLQIF